MILMSKCSPCAALLTHKYAILDSSSSLYRMFLVSIDSLFLLLYSSLLLIYIFLLCTLLYSFFFFSLVSLWQHNSSSSLSLLLRIRLCRFCCVLFSLSLSLLLTSSLPYPVFRALLWLLFVFFCFLLNMNLFWPILLFGCLFTLRLTVISVSFGCLCMNHLNRIFSRLFF